MTPDYIRYLNNNIRTNDNNNLRITVNNLINNYNSNNHYNFTNLINNLINNLNNHRIIDHPIDQIVPRDRVGIPVVDGYVFNGWEEDPVIVRGKLTNETNFYFGEGEVIPIGKPVTIGRPVFPSWTLDVYLICGRRV